MSDLRNRSSRVITDVCVAGYCWKSDAIALCQELPSPKERQGKVLTIDITSGRHTRLPYVELVAKKNRMFFDIKTSNDWILWYTWDSSVMKVCATRINHPNSVYWNVPYSSLFGGSLLTSPLNDRWTLLTETNGVLFATTGSPKHPGNIRQIALGLPAECLGARSGNGAKLLANIGGNRILAMGISSYFLKDGKCHLPLFSFDRYKGKSSIRSESLRFELVGRLSEIEYSPASNRMAILENLWDSERISADSHSSVVRYRLTTCHLDGSNVRVLGEVWSEQAQEPRLLRWLPNGKRISFAYDNAIWTVADEAV